MYSVGIKIIACFTLVLISTLLWGQITFPVNGVQDNRPQVYAFTHATIVVDANTIIENGTMIIEKQQIKKVGKNIPIPKNAIVTDLTNKFIYPSFIDCYTQYGIETNKATPHPHRPQYKSNTKGAYSWNEAIKSYQEAYKIFKNDPTKAEEYRNAGFGSVVSFQNDGIARGTSALVSLSDKRENEMIVKEKAFTHYSFHRGSSTQVYPTSLMGAIALLRQTFYDAQWYAGLIDKSEIHIELEAINQNKILPAVIEVTDIQNALRADKLGDEFGIQFIIKGTGDEYQRIETLQNTKASLIVPVDFPKPFDVTGILETELLPYTQMKHWELAPFNLYYLNKAKIPFVITSDGLKDRTQLIPAIRKAISCGFPAKEALRALTQSPAALVSMDTKIGTLKAGSLANFLITSDSIFKEGTKIYENWVAGEKYIVHDIKAPDVRGIYNLVWQSSKRNDSATLSITGKAEVPDVQIIQDTVKAKGQLTLNKDFFQLSFKWKGKDMKLTGWKDEKGLSGLGELPYAEKIQWKATLEMQYKAPEPSDSTKNAELKQKQKLDSLNRNVGKILYPFQAFGDTSFQRPSRILIKNAIIWTNEADGILSGKDIYIEEGKIKLVGKADANIKPQQIIDATGKHVTPGIIDEHSHIAISGGVNECSHSATSEVRIGDVIDAEDINIYRNLSGGVTAAQLLHGSCNSIGGQSGIVKLRWGKAGEDFKIKDAAPFIKFALGENVKQSNWGDTYHERFPQTRMGVEQVFVNAFSTAREYQQEWANYKLNSKSTSKPRKNLQLEAIGEILDKKRFITCHSYVQSEILMLMQVAEQFNIKVNTFTHILEGYKVADKMKQHGAGASTFSDWWAYKYEVRDAIPYNAAILNKIGVVTAINSDNAEMARRLNQEAAKAVKYGGVSEEDALKMVTLNPAKLLHLDKTLGSIKPGKDADLVIWSGHPLSIYSKAEYTFVDGQCLYSAEGEIDKQNYMKRDKIRLIKKMAEAQQKGEATIKPYIVPSVINNCESNP